MNRYGMLAMRHWEAHAPSRVAAMSDREGFFTGLGTQVAAQIAELTQRLEGTPVAGESYPEAVGRLTNARMRAEEIVLAELVWIETPELALAEAREEWEATRAGDSALASWADRIQDAPETEPATDEIEELAHKWAVTPEFLYGLRKRRSRTSSWRRTRGCWRRRANVRFLRERT